MKLSELLTDTTLRDETPIGRETEEIQEMKAFIEDMAVIKSYGRVKGGAGDGKIIGLIPLTLGPLIWHTDPEAFLSKKGAHEFLDENPQFKV